LDTKVKIYNVDQIVKKIKSDRLPKCEEELTRIYGQRYLDYRNNYQAAGTFSFESPFPMYIMLEQSYRCNMRCVSCIHAYAELAVKYRPRTPLMPWGLFERIVLEGEAHNCPSISTHNNDEPLLVKDLCRRISFAKRHGFMDVILTTNGTLFNEDNIKRIIEAGITRILFSLDAMSEETYNRVRPGGDYKKVIDAIYGTLSYRAKIGANLPMVRVSFVMNRFNQHEVVEFINHYNDVVDYIDIQPLLVFNGYSSHLIPDGAEQVDDFRCNAPWRVVVIRSDGDVLPCPNFYGAATVLGNIYQTDIYNIFNSECARKFRVESKRGEYTHKACKECASNVYYFPAL
jgi:radical SAM protein with 4Fe4S-binding SPASM domain